MQTILSGIRPTGGIHIGNYLGSLKQWTELSQEPDTKCFFMVADFHALAPEKDLNLAQNSLDLVAWQLACGLNPDSVIMFLQSAVPAHTQLSRILSTLVTVPELNRMTQYKDLIQQGTEKASLALLEYPVLQTADVILYRANIVPIGDDQLQHLELTRVLARRANTFVGKELFVIPNARLTASKRIMSLHNPEKKMSKSLPQGALLLEDDEQTLRAKVNKAVTDTVPITEHLPNEILTGDKFGPSERALLFEHMTPGVKNLFILLHELGDDNTLDSLLHNYVQSTLKYSELKQAVADAVVAFVVPLQERYKEIRNDEARLKEVLAMGNEEANSVANQTLKEAKEAFKILDI